MFLDLEIQVISLLLPLALILLISKLLQIGCKKVKLPQVIGMLLAGIIVGFIDKIPFINLLDDSARAGLKFLAEIGVILIMFSAGLGTNLRTVKESGKSSIIVTVMGVIVPMGLGFLVAGLFNGFTGTSIVNGNVVSKVWSNLFYGVILTATSVSVTVATLKELHRLNGKVGTIVMSAAIIDDIIGVVILSIVLSLSGAGGEEAKTLGSLMFKNNVVAVVANVIVFFIFTIGLGVGVHYYFKSLNKRKPHTRRIPLFGLAFCFFMAYAAEKFFGVAEITGAFFAGLALSGIGRHINPTHDALKDDTSDYIERKSDVLSYMIFSPIFFANVGISTDFSGIKLEILGFGLCFILAGLFGKVIGCGLGAKITGNSMKDSYRIGLGMMARAEVALICANKGISAGLVDPGMSAFIVLMIIVSSFVTPLLLKLSYKNEAPVKEDYNEELQEP